MSNLTGVQKIAVLLAVLGEEAAARVLAVFEPDEQERIGQAMVELEELQLGEDVIAGLVQEFRAMPRTSTIFRSRPERTLGAVMTRIYGDDEGRKRLGRIQEESRSRLPLRCLRGIPAPDLARVIREEHPQIQALVLAHMDPAQAADVLTAIPEEARPELVTRMATMDEPSPRLLKQVAQEMIERTRGLRREAPDRDEDPMVRAVADILNAAPSGTEKEILGRVDEDDADLGTRIREKMFTWVDLADLDRRTMQKVLTGVDVKVLALALKAGDPKVKESLLNATSQRTREMINEEKELLGAVPLGDVLDAQKQILATVRELVSLGEITLSKSGSSVLVQ